MSPDRHGILRGRRNEPSDEVPLCAWPTTITEGKMYAVTVARPDGKHLTVDDYQWIRRCLGLRDDTELVGLSPSPVPPSGESRTPCADGPRTLSSPGCAGPSLQETEQ